MQEIALSHAYFRCISMLFSGSSSRHNDFFRDRLEAIIDNAHPLVRLSHLMPWSVFEESFGRFYRPMGRPAKPTRLMVGLHYLKHVHDLSDEEVVARWVENPYWQFFCGFEFFQHSLPIDPSTMTRWVMLPRNAIRCSTTMRAMPRCDSLRSRSAMPRYRVRKY